MVALVCETCAVLGFAALSDPPRPAAQSICSAPLWVRSWHSPFLSNGRKPGSGYGFTAAFILARAGGAGFNVGSTGPRFSPSYSRRSGRFAGFATARGNGATMLAGGPIAPSSRPVCWPGPSGAWWPVATYAARHGRNYGLLPYGAGRKTNTADIAANRG